ncbi:MAG TPA: hypothetical protein VEK77_09500 [Gemmatimonadales bacterium]|nr:hypothetical protein [Gemmatimonadales bacterium]
MSANFTAIEVLHRRLILQAAAFQQQHRTRRADPLARDRDAGGAGADNAQIAFEQGAVGEGSSVDVHRG